MSDARTVLLTEEERFDRWVARAERTASGCLLWPGTLSTSGYGQFRLADGTLTSAHRYAWTLEHGPVPPGLVVRHTCDVRPCFERSHLLTGTPADNTRDMMERGRQRGPFGADFHTPERKAQIAATLRATLPRGAEHHAARLSAGQREEAAERVCSGESLSAVARSLGVSATTVGRVVGRYA